MTKNTKIINSLVFLVWAGLICLLLYRDHTGTALNRTGTFTGVIDKAVYWYDIYHGPQKIGFASTSYDKIGNENIMRQQREMQVMKNGKATVLYDTVKCICDPNYAIKSLEYSSHLKDEQGTRATGEVEAGNIIFLLESPEKRKTFTTPTNGKDIYLPGTLIPALIQQKPVSGSVFTVPVLDINSLLVSAVKIEMEELRPVKIGTDIRSLYKFRSGNSVWWSNEKGIIIKEETPIGLTLYNVPAQFEQDYTGKLISDYTNLPFIQSNKFLSSPEKLTRLKVKIKGFKLDRELYKNSIATLENDVLSIQKKEAAQLAEVSFQLPYGGDSFGQYLSPDPWVSSNYKPLHDTGIIYARTNKNDAFLFAQYLTGYLFNLVRTEPTFFITDAEDFLKSLRGDYAERTIMFASYSRAGGLPTRLVGGFVYAHGYFYFHTWPEVWLGQWVPADPTFYQFPADVTHIPLRAGTMKDIISLIDDLKDVNIEIMEAL